MSPWALPLIVLLQTRSAAVSPRPVAWAAQSPRPGVCLTGQRLWHVAKQTQLAHRCQELARAQALLLRAPAQALARAEALVTAAPDLTEARVLRGRAHLRVGDNAAALADLLPLLGDEAAVADPWALLDGGRAAIAQNDLPNAVRFYTTLGSRASLLPERQLQVAAYLEIAAALLAGKQAPVDDVLAYLREARRRSAGSGFTGVCAALTTLAWRAAGREAEAQAAQSELGDPAALEAVTKPPVVWLPRDLAQSAVSLGSERRAGKGATKAPAATKTAPPGAGAKAKGN